MSLGLGMFHNNRQLDCPSCTKDLAPLHALLLLLDTSIPSVTVSTQMTITTLKSLVIGVLTHSDVLISFTSCSLQKGKFSPRF